MTPSTSSPLRIIPLGGMGKVTQNMYLYEYEQEILVIDCGIGFPDEYMPGVDILIPDVRYLHQQLEAGKRIVGMILSHGHDDHIAATPYILPDLPEFPLYGSALTAGFAENRMAESSAPRPVKVVKDHTWLELGEHFAALPVAVPHSVPDTRHYAIKTPVGVVYHGTDFKLDPHPIDNVLADEESMKRLGDDGVRLMLIDCLRVERREWVPSESTTGPAIEAAMATTRGKSIVTLMSSHIHRIQQTIDAAVKHQRRVAFVGRSVEQNVEVALRLKKLKIPAGVMIDKRDLNQVPDRQLCVIIAGSQGQEGSSLVRAVFGDHPVIRIKPQDKVLFSADAIPGNEIQYYQAVDELSRNRIDVIYPEILPDIHQSGHASAPEQRQLVEWLRPDYVMPIGGADRHRVKFIEFVAEPAGYQPEQVLIPDNGEVVSLRSGDVKFAERVSIVPRAVDGLGIGDVGPQVLNDRRALAEAGMIVVVIPRDKEGFRLRDIEVISRGFVFMKEAQDVVSFIKDVVIDELKTSRGRRAKVSDLRHKLERRLGRKLYKAIQRQPMIMVVVLDV